MDQQGIAVAVFIESPMGLVLVRNRTTELEPYFWKLPGGKAEPGETVDETALREITEEVGLTLDRTRLTLRHQEARTNHTFFLFSTTVPDLKGIKTVGNEGEDVRVLSLERVKALHDLFPSHRRILEQLEIL